MNYASATARVAYRPGECSPGVLKRAVQAAGYDLLTDADGPRRNRVVAPGWKDHPNDTRVARPVPDGPEKQPQPQ